MVTYVIITLSNSIFNIRFSASTETVSACVNIALSSSSSSSSPCSYLSLSSSLVRVEIFFGYCRLPCVKTAMPNKSSCSQHRCTSEWLVLMNLPFLSGDSLQLGSSHCTLDVLQAFSALLRPSYSLLLALLPVLLLYLP